MTLLEIMKKRCSIRDYASRAVEEEKINYILEAARLAPSAGNFQAWSFWIVSEKENREKIAACYPREWFKTAPMYIVVCGDHGHSWKRPHDGKDHLDVDAGIATEHICLAAAEQDLGTCIVCHFDAALMRELFSIPPRVEPIVLISIGYPAAPELFEETPKKRKALDEIVKKL